MDLLVSPINKGMPLTPTPSIRHDSWRLATPRPSQPPSKAPSIAPSRHPSLRRKHSRLSPQSSRRGMQTPMLMVSDMDAGGDGASTILSSFSCDEADEDQANKPPPPAWYMPERHLIAIKFVYFFVYANTACLIPYFVTYYIEWGLTPTELSLIQAAVPFFGFLVRPIIGRLADVTNRHRAVFAACCLWCAFFHLPHMFVPKLTPLESTNLCNVHNHDSRTCNNTDTEVDINGNSTISGEDHSSSSSSSLFSDPDRLPTLTLLLGLRLVAYAGQAPTQDLADAFCYAAVDRDPRRWGRQRVWSTVGWAGATFTVGYILNELGSHYWLFVITAVFNVLAAFSIIFLKPLAEGSPTMVGHGGGGGGESGGHQRLGRTSSKHSSRSTSRKYRPSTASSTTTGAFSASTSHFSKSSAGTMSSSSFQTASSSALLRSRASTHTSVPQVTLTMLLKQTHVQIYLLFSMLSGSLLAIEFSFLLIFLTDQGGDKLLIGLHQVVDSLSEFPLFLFSGYIISWLGFVPCFCLSFCTYIIRLISYSFLTQELYYVLLVEIVHCFSFTLYVAAGTGYADSITAPGLEATLQSMFQGVFFGLGIGAGNLIGGFLYPVIGARWLFRGGAVVAAICAIAYAAINYSGILKTRKASESAADLSSRMVLNTNATTTPSTVVAFGAHTMSIKTIDNDGSTLAGDDTRSLDRRSSSLLIPPTPVPTSELFRAADGLHRSPGVGRVPMIVMMTPLTARILAKDGVIKFIDE